jgi:ribosomal protein L11 methylase PrmA
MGMLLRLPSGLKIAIPPGLPWEDRRSSIIVDSRGAFYPGHATTKLCLSLMDETLCEGRCRSLLDIGCGSGILALTAAFMDVAFIVGLDIDPRAVAASSENAAKNRMNESIHWVAGSAACVRGFFDCIAANLPFAVVMNSLHDFARLLDPNGYLILSGFHDIEFHLVNEELLSVGLEIRKWVSGDQSFYGVPPSGSFTWMAVLATRRQT